MSNAYCSLPLMEVFSTRPNRHKTLEDAFSYAPIPDGGGKLLEIACGDGAAACYIAGHHPMDVLGVDISKPRIAKAQETASSTELTAGGHIAFRCENFFESQLDTDFSHVYCEDFYCSLPEEDKVRFAKRAFELLRPGGYMVLFDFTVGKGGSEDEQVQIDTIPCFLGIKKMDTYNRYFQDAGFEVVVAKDQSMRLYQLGAHLAQSYGVEVKNLGRVLATVEAVDKGLPSDVPEQEVTQKQEKLGNFFVNAKIGCGLMVYQKR